MSLPQELRSAGIELVPEEDWFKAICPFHVGGSSSDTIVVCRFNDEWIWKCWACGAGGDSLQDWEMWQNGGPKMRDIVERLRSIDGFGWQCGQPLKDKGNYWRCSCGCSQPADDWDGSMKVTQPAILREAADAIERLIAERDQARRDGK